MTATIKKTIDLYRFEDLNDKIKEKVLNEFRNNIDYSYLNDFLTEILKEELTNNKIIFDNTLKIYYSLSNCQGDGFCFIGNFEYKDIKVYIKHNSNYYYHQRSTILYFEDNNFNEIENKTTDYFYQLYLNICKKIEKIGYKIIDYEESETTIKQYFEDNNYYFTKNAEMKFNEMDVIK